MGKKHSEASWRTYLSAHTIRIVAQCMNCGGVLRYAFSAVRLRVSGRVCKKCPKTQSEYKQQWKMTLKSRICGTTVVTVMCKMDGLYYLRTLLEDVFDLIQLE